MIKLPQIRNGQILQSHEDSKMETENVDATPLMLACKKGDIIEVMQLVKNDADVNAADRNNSTALMYAVVSDVAKSETNANHGLIINFLLDNDAEVNINNMMFESPSSLAAKKDDPESLQKFIDHGANNFNIINMIEGKTVYDYANENSCKAVLDDFKKRLQPVEEKPASPSFLKRALDVVLFPFRLLGKILKSIGAAIVQIFINRSSDTDSIPTVKKLTSEKFQRVEHVPDQNVEEPVASTKKKFDFDKEKKIHIFNDVQAGDKVKSGMEDSPQVSGDRLGSPKNGERKI